MNNNQTENENQRRTMKKKRKTAFKTSNIHTLLRRAYTSIGDVYVNFKNYLRIEKKFFVFTYYRDNIQLYILQKRLCNIENRSEVW